MNKEKWKIGIYYNTYQYTGRRLDEETGQYYYRARMYSAEQSRFTTQDPAGMTDGPNMYAYVGNNPVNKRDPTGLSPGDAIIDGGGAGGDGDTCPGEASYETWDRCMYWQQDTETCAELCFGDDYDGNPGAFVRMNNKKYEDCIKESNTESAVQMAAPCIVGAVTVGAVFTILSGVSFSAIIGASFGGPAGAAGAMSVAGVGILVSIAGGCLANELLKEYAGDIIWCGVKSLYI